MKMKVQMNGYSLQTLNYSSNWDHIKTWAIEGRNEDSDWTIIDKRPDNNDLNGYNFQHYYSIPEITKPYQYIRIRSLGPDHGGCHYLPLSHLEIYGTIIED